MELYQYRDKIGEHLLAYILSEGYSKSSFSTATGVSRPTLNLILTGNSPNASTYYKQMGKITNALGYPIDYFVTSLKER
ncbi:MULTISPECIES: helix-turn-helix domain-containing protein [unclassified Psychrobacillus]|uniref:helix-turn-helix domain-containing protein n=1 Tax=unclassified Psychrobacillus TaxID=2636677 RepID=UPI0030F74B11